MITTGPPAASLCATCGSDPTDRGAPLGGRHGTRLKISPADFATCLTLSIALSVRLLGCAWPAGGAWLGLSAGAALPCSAFSATGTAGFAPSDLALSEDFVLSDLPLSENAACWADSARTGTVAANVSSTSAAAEANHMTQKGR